MEAEARAFLESYGRSFRDQDVAAMLGLMALDDPRFCLYEDVSPGLMDAVAVEEMVGFLPKLVNPDMAFRDVLVYPLAKGLCLVTTRQGVRVDTPQGRQKFVSRSSLLLINRGEKWQLLHAHFSPEPAAPEQPQAEAAPTPETESGDQSPPSPTETK
ncbi:MAG: nuclear transport factor 2 family protein [Proteobacteria bacterium]|nr:nuclear transport factor 2 family protein [Pseudomonadota bacterium]MBU1741958.1 nuclear transport factor 2 family protein [Pseudomonadota bacterium]